MLRPEDVIDRVDLGKFFSPLHRKIHADGYVKLVEHAPEMWGLLFSKTDDPRMASRLSRLKRIFPGQSRKKFEAHVAAFKPDAVLCTHYLPLETLGRLREKARRPRHRFATPLLAKSVKESVSQWRFRAPGEKAAGDLYVTWKNGWTLIEKNIPHS